MQPTSDKQVVAFDFLTEDEKEFNTHYVKKLVDFSKGIGDINKIKVLTQGARTITDRQRARCAYAILSMAVKSETIKPAHQKCIPAEIEPRSSVSRVRGEGGAMLLPPRQCKKCKKPFTPEFEAQTVCGNC